MRKSGWNIDLVFFLVKFTSVFDFHLKKLQTSFLSRMVRQPQTSKATILVSFILCQCLGLGQFPFPMHLLRWGSHQSPWWSSGWVEWKLWSCMVHRFPTLFRTWFYEVTQIELMDGWMSGHGQRSARQDHSSLSPKFEQSRGRVRFKVHERQMLSWVSADGCLVAGIAACYVIFQGTKVSLSFAKV